MLKDSFKKFDEGAFLIRGLRCGKVTHPGSIRTAGFGSSTMQVFCWFN
jgi:hypothetical protein